MTATLDVLSKVTKLDEEIDALKERITVKQRERQSIIDAAQAALSALTPTRVGVGSGNHTSRRGVPKGTPNLIHRKFNPAQIKEIRKRWAKGETQGSLSREFGVPQPTISNIVHRKTYQDIK